MRARGVSPRILDATNIRGLTPPARLVRLHPPFMPAAFASEADERSRSGNRHRIAESQGRLGINGNDGSPAAFLAAAVFVDDPGARQEIALHVGSDAPHDRGAAAGKR